MGRASLVSKYKIGELMSSLTDKQQLFILFYVETNNATLSAKKAGYSQKSADVQGAKLLKNKKVSDVIGEVRRRMLEAHLVRAEEVMEQLSFLITRDVSELIGDDGFVHSDIREMPRSIRSSIDGLKQTIEYDEDGNVTEIKNEVKLSPKAAAVDMGLKVFQKYEKEGPEEESGGIDWSQFWKSLAEPDLVEEKMKALEDKSKPSNKYEGEDEKT